jgi:hypothetical protein
MLGCAILGVPLALISVSSLLVAYGFVRKKKWVGTLALVQDLVLVIVAARMLAREFNAFTTGGVSSAPMIWWASAVGASGLLLAGEASHLLRSAWARGLAWPAFSALAAALLLICVIMPPAVNERLGRHVGPLLAYTRTHWFSIPSGSRVSVTQRPWDDTSGPGSVGHRDTVDVETENAAWNVTAHHLDSGRWQLPEPYENLAVFSGRVPGRGDIRSVSAARRLLEDAGVVDRDLRPVRLSEGTKTISPEIPPPSARFGPPYRLWSPRGRGLYYVSEDGEISFFVKHRLELP